ncbi:glycosyltransferase family 2 protein [uncultured Planktomarina sp.]|jgi:N-acetylglucosaminyl-diphospho-decaprenol L-rhamnosyltransferase|uniref:glycosyltransferase family 2 protein n=1 Tax=uncultured Planktomarina sp. TaxID=1538529 RepID=UPI003261AE6A
MSDEKKEDSVTIVTVSYNSAEILRRMLTSAPKDLEVVVVDNFSDDLNDIRELCLRFGASLVENSVNRGFGSACNSGANLATTEFIFFLNPDCVLKNDTVDKLILAARRNPTSPAFNPRIMLDNGEPSFNYKSALLPRSKWMRPGWPDTDQEVNILSGCAIFVRRSDFIAVGGFDPNIFLYHEDDDLSLRLAERGPLMFISDAVVRHSVGSSSGDGIDVAAFKAWHLGYSRIYARHKHGLPLFFTTTFIGALFKALLPDVIFSRRKRAKRWPYLQGMFNALKRL